MDKKKLKAYIFMSVFWWIVFFVVIGVMIYGLIKRDKFSTYVSVIGLPVVSFLTSLFITQAVKTNRKRSTPPFGDRTK